MRYMTIVKGPENAGMPPKEVFEAVDKLTEEQTRSGTLLAFGGLRPSADGMSVRISKGKLVVTDGPFTEAKEVIGGFAIMEFKSKAEALEQARHFMEMHMKLWPGWEGECEIRALEAAGVVSAGAVKAL